MQYARPPGENFFFGDPMPWSDGEAFHLYILLDHDHHLDKGGLGGHQWAHFSSRDLVQWQEHPLAIPLGAPGSYDQWSICTGSIVFHEGLYYAFYATRISQHAGWDGLQGEQLCLATSRDGIHFNKARGNPFFAPPEMYHPRQFRDPHVFRDETSEVFHMLVTAWLAAEPPGGRGGCLAHLISRDLQLWTLEEPFFAPGLRGAPECPDLFWWNGWYYLLFALNGPGSTGVTRYRMARELSGPWLCPAVDTFDGLEARVMKTAAWRDNRRLGAAFVPWRAGAKDDGAWQYGGNVVFRELVQHEDGTLGTKLPAEMTPGRDPPIRLAMQPAPGALVQDGDVSIDARYGWQAVRASGAPDDARLVCDVEPEPDARHFGLYLRASEDGREAYELRFSPQEKRVRFVRRSPNTPNTAPEPEHALWGVEGLERGFRLEVVLHDDLLDVCVGDRRCMISRFPEQRGACLFFWSENAQVRFRNVEVRALAPA